MKIAAFVIGLLLVCGFAVYAQGPFADVPTDHWAYEAVNQLQQDGILIGYPDGTFGGKRAMTRYEFAVAIARMIPIIGTGGKGGVSQEEFNALQNRVTALENAPKPPVIDVSQFCTKADCDAIRKLVDEFRDELAALGVDVDCLKRDVAALNDRVTALEKEMRRFVWNAEVDAIGTAGDLKTPGVGGVAFDKDDRAIATDDMIRNISALENVNLKFRGGLAENVTASVMGVVGNYLSWIGTVDDYSIFTRPDSRATGLTTQAALYYAGLDWALGNGKISVGRVPIQWTPYTLKMIDVDSYTNISYTDSGNYPVDGATLDYRFGTNFKLNAFAAKNNEMELLKNGLTSQPTSGLYNDALGFGVPFNAIGGHAAGGLDFIDQSAGVRLQFGDAAKYTIGGSWMQAAGPEVTVAGLGTFDSVDVFGADLNWIIGSFLIGGQWAQTTTLGTGATSDLDDRNQAIDGKIGWNIGKFGIDGGWKRVESNFTAPGFWDKLGRWTNPSNVEGWYTDLSYGFASNLAFIAKAEFLEGRDTLGAGFNLGMNDEDDSVNYYQAGIKWGLSAANALTLGFERVAWDPTEGGDTDETYWSIGWGYQMNPSAGFKLMYQIIDYDTDGAAGPYGVLDYKANVAVAQFGVKF
jgi:hypothetical protein